MGGMKLVDRCKQDKPLQLLGRLNISISELMMMVAAKDKKIGESPSGYS